MITYISLSIAVLILQQYVAECLDQITELKFKVEKSCLLCVGSITEELKRVFGNLRSSAQLKRCGVAAQLLIDSL